MGLLESNQTQSGVFLIKWCHHIQLPRSASQLALLLLCFNIHQTNEQLNVALSWRVSSNPASQTSHSRLLGYTNDSQYGRNGSRNTCSWLCYTGINQRHHFIQPLGDCDVFVWRGKGKHQQAGLRGKDGCLETLGEREREMETDRERERNRKDGKNKRRGEKSIHIELTKASFLFWLREYKWCRVLRYMFMSKQQHLIQTHAQYGKTFNITFTKF